MGQLIEEHIPFRIRSLLYTPVISQGYIRLPIDSGQRETPEDRGIGSIYMMPANH